MFTHVSITLACVCTLERVVSPKSLKGGEFQLMLDLRSDRRPFLSAITGFKGIIPR